MLRMGALLAAALALAACGPKRPVSDREIVTSQQIAVPVTEVFIKPLPLPETTAARD